MKKSSVKQLLFAAILLTSSTVTQCHWLYMSKVFALGAKVMCDGIVGLVGTQRELCRSNPDVMTSIGKGAKLAVEHCQQQFKRDRWNCSTIDHDASVFGKVMRRSNKETAFVHAITSAGVVFEVTRACSRGELRECNCDRKRKRTASSVTEKGFTWGGCSENVGYGIQYARSFIDSKESQQDPQALMNLHNNKVGRRAVRRFMELRCKCHGVSGSCSAKSCWMQMLPFEAVAIHLRKRYLSALKVTIDQSSKSLTKINKNKKPSGGELVYLEESPDYCLPNPGTGSLGTAGRECNRTSSGVGSCAVLCCGRGFDTMRTNDESKCDCQFQWCCYVECKSCRYKIDKHICKAHTISDERSSSRSGSRLRPRNVPLRKNRWINQQ